MPKVRGDQPDTATDGDVSLTVFDGNSDLAKLLSHVEASAALYGDDNLAVLQPVGWPTGTADGVPRTSFRPALIESQSAVAIVQLVEVGDTIAAGAVVWSAPYPSLEEALLRFRWLDDRQAMCTHLGRCARLFGAAEIASDIEVGAETERLRAEDERARAVKEAEDARAEAEWEAKRANTIECFLHDREGRFGLCLQRGNATEPFWAIRFREKWERERFRDWFVPSLNRAHEWADFLETHSAVELERRLLAEMLETERAVKKAKLGAGGRRPLRFWRGEN